MCYNIQVKDFSFNYAQKLRSKILRQNKTKDSVFFEGKKNILISVPHGVNQTRLGKNKVAEIGTIPVGAILAGNTGCHLIVKTKNNFDDANFDEYCEYRKCMAQIIKQHNIEYIIDVHGLAKWREMDINLCTNLGNNIKNNQQLFQRLHTALKSSFKVSIDQPFMAPSKTISGHFSQKFNLWALQIEINCGITNEIKI